MDDSRLKVLLDNSKRLRQRRPTIHLRIKPKVQLLLWVARVGLQALTLMSALMVCLPFGWAMYVLNGCPLFAHIRLVDTDNGTLLFDTGETLLGGKTTCNYVLFICLVDIIYAVIWSWFYMVLTDWGTLRSEYNSVELDMMMTIPSLVVSSLLCLGSVTVLFILVSGYLVWCWEIMRGLSHIRRDCSYTREMPWSLEGGEKTYTYLLTATVSSSLLALVMGAQVVNAGFRFNYYIRRYTADEEPTLRRPAPVLHVTSAACDVNNQHHDDEEDGDTATMQAQFETASEDSMSGESNVGPVSSLVTV